MRRALLLSGALTALSCNDPPAPRPERQTVVVMAPAPPVMECRFDPVSTSGGPRQSGAEMCFTSAEQTPWWLAYSAADAGGKPDASQMSADAGSANAAQAALDPAACPPEMVLVEGMYCPRVRHRCLRYIDDSGPNGFLSRHRCAEFDKEPECLGPREQRRFCIDRDEYTAPAAELPLVEQSWTMARELCESLGKRLCFESEWEFACEGEELRPYPYGFERKAEICNHDRPNLTRRGKLRDLRVASESRPQCVSPFGVRNLVGNVDEWAHRDGFIKPYRSSLRGGWWLAGRNNCRAATTGHDEYYHGPQTGVRCCANPR